MAGLGRRAALHPNQAAPFFEEAVSLCRDTGDDIYLVRGLNGLGNVAALSHSAAAARTHMRQAIDLARRTGNGVGLGHALTNAGIWVSALSGAFDEATKQLQEGLYLARARGDLLFTALTLYGLALVATSRGEYEAAAELLEEALAASVTSGTAGGESLALSGVGILALARGDPRQRSDHSERLCGWVSPPRTSGFSAWARGPLGQPCSHSDGSQRRGRR